MRYKLTPAIYYGFINLFAIILVNSFSDLPVGIGNWENKSSLIASFKSPQDNFYPPGGAILLMPFLAFKPNFEIAIYFYCTLTSVIFYFICHKLLKNRFIFYVSLGALTLNPYLIWLVNFSQDTVFELFLLVSSFALLLSKKFFIAFFPLYLLCLTRPAYWTCFLVLPIIIKVFKIKNFKNNLIPKKIIALPILFLFMTLGLNNYFFNSLALAGEAGLTAHFAHNKYFYLSMPKFDPDVFLSKGGNMSTDLPIPSSEKYSGIKNEEFRAALIDITQNPKSFFLNSLQKIDSYFFAVQKNPQLSGEYYLSPDQKSIIIGNSRDSWGLILGSYLYFIYRVLLLVLGISAITLLTINPKLRNKISKEPVFLFCLPYLFGAIAGLLFYTETRFKIVPELLLVPLIAYVFEESKRYRMSLLT